MVSVDEVVLDEKLAELEKVRAWSPRTVAKLEALLHAPDETAVLRINPYSFARERNLAPGEALDLFLHAAHLGLVTMDWHLLCPHCGAAVESFASLRGLHSHIFCGLCQMHAEASLDDFIQVSFTVAPRVRRIAYHDPSSLSAADYFYNLRMSREMHMGSLDGPRLRDVFPQLMKVLEWVGPGQLLGFGFDATAGSLAIAELQSHCGLVVEVTDDAPAGPLELVIEDSRLTTTRATVRSGRVEGTVRNLRATPLVFALDHQDGAQPAEMPPSVLEPMVTGATLLTNQTFRRLFRTETVQGSEGIGVREVTILFTDLKGSTALYERIGDLRAFSRVQQHFEQLGAVTAEHGGTIVKTIGDAVMAAFLRPADAVRAAFAMLACIGRFNREQGADDIVLKIGIHRGPSIAVTLNHNLDYFGHTVNVAARVQGLADAYEIYVTDAVYQADQVPALLGDVVASDAQLRGIQREVRVYKATRPA